MTRDNEQPASSATIEVEPLPQSVCPWVTVGFAHFPDPDPERGGLDSWDTENPTCGVCCSCLWLFSVADETCQLWCPCFAGTARRVDEEDLSYPFCAVGADERGCTMGPHGCRWMPLSGIVFGALYFVAATPVCAASLCCPTRCVVKNINLPAMDWKEFWEKGRREGLPRTCHLCGAPCD